MNINDIGDIFPDALKADGFDDCILGVTHDGCIAYDAQKMIHKLMSDDGMDEGGAVEYFDFNIAGAYMGEKTPIYIYK